MDRVIKAARSSGSLNLSNRSLREVPTEVYQNLDTAGEGDRWWEAVDLHKLILAHNNIEVLKEDLKNLPLLTVLNVSHNKLTQLPVAIGELTLLKSLDVSFNSIANIPEEIGSATSLVKFDCSNNQIKELPNSLGHCSELSELKASNNYISSLPEDLVNCKKMMKLDVEGNKLTQLSENLVAAWTRLTELNASKNLLDGIPESIGKLSRLIRLDLHMNRISSIPSSIKGCSSLAEFYMGNNVLLSLPAELGELSRLGTFDLHSNKICNTFSVEEHLSRYWNVHTNCSGLLQKSRENACVGIQSISLFLEKGHYSAMFLRLAEYPVEACKLRLSVLDLSNNSLSGLPAEIGLMTSLRKLVLIGNPMRTIRSTLVTGSTPALLKYLRSRLPSAEDSEAATPSKEDVVGMATRLSLSSKELSLGGMSLTSVPSEVCTSSDITKVDLSRNSIEELPLELSSCLSLEALILSRNKIKDWPGEVLKSLPNLTCLKLDNNPLKQIPSNGFEAASKLQILDLSGCAASLAEHLPFANLPQLLELYLRRIRLQDVPSDIVRLQKLQVLDLSQNSIQSIPEELKNLTSLTELDLSDNSIAALPAELGLLESNLQVLRIDGNPLRSIRRTILDRGTKAILKYLKDKL